MLQGLVAIITGAGGGIGQAAAVKFVQEGARVILAEIGAAETTLRRLQSLPGHNAAHYLYVKTDVSKESEVAHCVDMALQTFGRLDVLVNNAVAFEFGHLLPAGVSGSGTRTDHAISSEQWDRVFRVNILGYSYGMKHAVKAMQLHDADLGVVYTNDQIRGTSTIDARCRGSIINVCSVSSFIAQPEFVPYNTSKGAILQMTRCCALDFAPLKVRVNAVSPGTIETEGSHKHMELVGLSLEEGRRVFGNSCAMKRQAAPEEVANAICFLASTQSSFMTGSNLVIDGGATFY